ncbi:MAG: hypothetical protein ACFE0O_04385 [Opitutales bacterium]
MKSLLRLSLWGALFLLLALIVALRAPSHGGERADKQNALLAQALEQQVKDQLEATSEQTQAQPQRPEPVSVAVKPIKTKPAAPAPAAPVQSESEHAEGMAIPVALDYRRHLGFPGYVKLMQRIGGQFYLFDQTRAELIARTDPLTGAFGSVRKEALARFSPISRSVQGEVAVNQLLKHATRRFGPGDYQVVLLIPSTFEKRLQTQLRQALQRRGIAPSRVAEAHGAYLASPGGRIRLNRLNLNNGETVAVAVHLVP